MADNDTVIDDVTTNVNTSVPRSDTPLHCTPTPRLAKNGSLAMLATQRHDDAK
eukprot:CAMPEP_0168591518 /NCGR_PEP_ID=MMETSP0420-20121227/7183_1 /TAXON_ID=498008 /ORGANISM="Pessonella sp." /LENGTH=52 /DNA_ID=CAMNT_0008627327 /DNA_START=539 /DNA_END=697 /DNA_ORIENTATION=+